MPAPQGDAHSAVPGTRAPEAGERLFLRGDALSSFSFSQMMDLRFLLTSVGGFWLTQPSSDSRAGCFRFGDKFGSKGSFWRVLQCVRLTLSNLGAVFLPWVFPKQSWS